MKYLIFILFISNHVLSQDIKQHKWKERIVIINSDKKNLELAENQLKMFLNEEQKLIDRKVVLYNCVESDCSLYNWKGLIKTITNTSEVKGFKVTLIGLDGGVKYTSNKVENPNIILDLIDSMPMRRQEMKAEKNND